MQTEGIDPSLLEEYHALLSEAEKVGYDAYWTDENDLLPKAITDGNISKWYTEVDTFRKLNRDQKDLVNAFVRDIGEKHTALVRMDNNRILEIKRMPFGDGYSFRDSKNGKWQAMGVIETEWEFISWVNQSGAVLTTKWE